MQKILVSACLLGEKVRYDGGDCAQESNILRQWQAEGRLAPVCPEVAGGLPVPRPAAEIQGDGVINIHGEDVTAQFAQGAQQALALCRKHDIRMAILKEGSPSCGSTLVNDGTFSSTKVSGQGVTTLLLETNGIRVFSEQQMHEAAGFLKKLEQSHVE